MEFLYVAIHLVTIFVPLAVVECTIGQRQNARVDEKHRSAPTSGTPHLISSGTGSKRRRPTPRSRELASIRRKKFSKSAPRNEQSPKSSRFASLFRRRQQRPSGSSKANDDVGGVQQAAGKQRPTTSAKQLSSKSSNSQLSRRRSASKKRGIFSRMFKKKVPKSDNVSEMSVPSVEPNPNRSDVVDGRLVQRTPAKSTSNKFSRRRSKKEKRSRSSRSWKRSKKNPHAKSTDDSKKKQSKSSKSSASSSRKAKLGSLKLDLTQKGSQRSISNKRKAVETSKKSKSVRLVKNEKGSRRLQISKPQRSKKSSKSVKRSSNQLALGKDDVTQPSIR